MLDLLDIRYQGTESPTSTVSSVWFAELAGDDVEVRPVHAGHLLVEESRRDGPRM
jgi:hypothetical protein